jgi:ferredoxin
MAAMLAKKIDDALKPFGAPLWGVCEMDSTLSLPEKYEHALVVIIPFQRMLTIGEYSEPLFKGLQWGSFSQMRNVSAALVELLRSQKIRFGFPPDTESADTDAFERNMTEAFSAKEAARRAGLGWIGKNNLLVTERYGPRISIFTILCDIPIPAGTPSEKSRCGSCRMCAQNCAFHVIRGVLWVPGTRRDEQVDYAKCSLTRLKGYETIGRKATCGKCVAACPFGTGRTPRGERLAGAISRHTPCGIRDPQDLPVSGMPECADARGG